MMNIYIHQHPDFALGNFIQCTPTIRRLAEYYYQPIPVLFSTKYVRQCFLDCPFIKIIDDANGLTRLFGSDLVNPNNDKPDYEYIFQEVLKEKWTPEFHTYVDEVPMQPTHAILRSKKIVVINGSGTENPDYVKSKDPGEYEYRALLSLAIIRHRLMVRVVTTGSRADAKRNPYLLDICDECNFGNIRTSLAHIATADLVIANDTGLAHAAGALNKNLLVLWKDTPRDRCKNPGINTRYVYHMHRQAIIEEINKL